MFGSTPKLVLPPPPEGQAAWDMSLLEPLAGPEPSSPGFFTSIFQGTTDIVQSLFMNLHETGMPWWVSVIAGTAVMRTVLFPTKVASLINSKRMNAATQEFTVRVAPLLQQKFPNEKEYSMQVIEAKYKVIIRLARNWPR